MIRNRALPIFAAMLAAVPLTIAAQNTPEQAADAAQIAAARADEAFERIDPDTEVAVNDDAAAIYAGLPPLTAEGAVVPPAPVVDPAPRGPAVRTIELPAPVSAPKPIVRASNDSFVIKSILPIEGTIRYGDWFWNESAAPKTGKLVITVDLEARVISAFRDGHEIGTAVALLGTRSHPTPLGTFPILTKEKDNVSEKYDNAPMPWTLRLTWDGVAIHGSPVLNGYASHGCVGVPDAFAAKLFAAAKRGDKVIITRGKIVGVGDKVL
ncbi:MAG: L,D-transpeptidase family protein [Rhizobiales bacterium]|nr:L,D-transpeptidase family protein [Hyphomicrobiales bacterium]